MDVAKRVSKLREFMKENNIDIYVVPTADFHQSEYVGEHFKARAFITGFTGSAGTAVFTQEEAGLWTDGRYFIQAANQLKDSGVELRKMGEPGVPTINEYLEKAIPENGVLGFDGRVVSYNEGNTYESIVKDKNARIVYDVDLVNEVWANRPSISKEPVFYLEEKYSGESTESKLKRVREYMKENKATAHVIGTLDDIGWLYNIRGNDVKFFPLILSYSIIYNDKATLYIEKSKVSDEIKEKLKENNVEIKPYNDIYEDVKGFSKEDAVLVDPQRINYALISNISDNVKIIKKDNPTILFKAIKNETEIKNIKEAQLKDSIVHVKFMRWLKENALNTEITELSAQDKLEELRMEQPNYLWQSFAPISGFGKHAAMPHYEASPETNLKLEAGNFYLSDTGAGYMEGSTDITRTYAIGEVSEELKHDFTLVLKGHLGLARAIFLEGCCGANLDVLARQPLWDRLLNFNHGTGHGLGYLGNIHEPPTGFNWKFIPNSITPLKPGMLLTNEPGLYIEGSHGIRLENDILVVEHTKNEYGKFLCFEPLTYIPFDLDSIDVTLLTDREKDELNTYHKAVYEKLSSYLGDEDKEFLKKYTRAI